MSDSAPDLTYEPLRWRATDLPRAYEGRPVPVIERAFDVLSATVPRDGRAVLNWGDSRIGNILYHFQPVAVLDWEMATGGPTEVDLAWMTFCHAFFQTLSEQYGFPGLPELLRRDQAAATYERLSGHGISNLAWYEAYAALRFAIISVRTRLRSVAYGVQPAPAHPDDDDVIPFLPLFERLLEEL
jgi:aminoglycoside phosphotransferase (APT) family kinase protein